MAKYYKTSHGYKHDGVEYEHQAVLREAGIEIPPGYEVDHIDGKRSNNDPSNLRVCTSSQNKCNCGKRSHNTSGFKGVCWSKANKGWRAAIRVSGVFTYMGVHSTPEAAARAYDFASAVLHGRFGYQNFPLGG